MPIADTLESHGFQTDGTEWKLHTPTGWISYSGDKFTFCNNGQTLESTGDIAKAFADAKAIGVVAPSNNEAVTLTFSASDGDAVPVDGSNADDCDCETVIVDDGSVIELERLAELAKYAPPVYDDDEEPIHMSADVEAKLLQNVEDITADPILASVDQPGSQIDTEKRDVPAGAYDATQAELNAASRQAENTGNIATESYGAMPSKKTLYIGAIVAGVIVAIAYFMVRRKA